MGGGGWGGGGAIHHACVANSCPPLCGGGVNLNVFNPPPERHRVVFPTVRGGADGMWAELSVRPQIASDMCVYMCVCADQVGTSKDMGYRPL